MAVDVLLCAAGFVLLYFGAEWLVKGSSSLAKSLGVPAIVIGLTVVAFGTSAPEFVVSVISSLQDKSMIAVGNVFGSNICNIALVLGCAATLHRITCDRLVVRRDIPIMLGISVAVLLLCMDDTLTRVEGALLFGGLIAYTYMNYRFSRRRPATVIALPETPEAAARALGALETGVVLGVSTLIAGVGYLTGDVVGGNIALGLVFTTLLVLGVQEGAGRRVSSRLLLVLLVVAGIYGVVEGAKIVVESAERIMTVLGVDEKFIGLTVVAFGTSLPELATSVVAAMRNEMDISIGNLVGSNVFNLLGVLGVASLVRPIVIPGGFVESGLVIDGGVMLVISALPWFFLRRRGAIGRRQGLLLLGCYAAFLAYLVVRA